MLGADPDDLILNNNLEHADSGKIVVLMPAPLEARSQNASGLKPPNNQTQRSGSAHGSGQEKIVATLNIMNKARWKGMTCALLEEKASKFGCSFGIHYDDEDDPDFGKCCQYSVCSIKTLTNIHENVIG
ncbi:hypothetical protein NDU88_004692 [Pleurodeles waltl]|uniref:Uncharacterized protein n=1 Tax=Pleurodeles waltl TaxID=8319 RepID=A0AAV7T8U9_PLEWA|nr:hypothetical protein NDU88_004692 [Pleurodeles waltl]